MKWVFGILFGALLLMGGAIAGGAFIDPVLYVERSVKIDAPDYEIFPWANDLSKAHSYSPWYLADTGADVAFSGPPEGVGQTVAWRSDIIGIGTQIITDSAQDSLVRSRVTFAGQEGDMIFALQPADGGGTFVLLSYETELGGFPFLDRLMKGQTQAEWEKDFDRSLSVLEQLLRGEAAPEE